MVTPPSPPTYSLLLFLSGGAQAEYDLTTKGRGPGLDAP